MKVREKAQDKGIDTIVACMMHYYGVIFSIIFFVRYFHFCFFLLSLAFLGEIGSMK